MKWRLTGRFLLSVVIIVIIVLIANVIILLATAIITSKKDFTYNAKNTPEHFARNFEHQFEIIDSLPVLTKEGLDALQQADAYVQFLNTNGDVIESVYAPEELPSHYAPIDLVSMYKYEQLPNVTSYVYAKEDISYIIGIKDPDTFRYIATFNFKQILELISQYALYMLIVDILITILIAFFFGRSLTKPLTQILNQIQYLKNRKFTTMPTKKGLYSEVFQNLNAVSEELAAHEQERLRLEVMREEWIGNISHDMKTPLASIRGYAEIMQEADTLAEMITYAQVIEKQSLHMGELLDDLNLTMRLRNQQLPLQLQTTNIVSFSRELLIELLNEPRFESYDLQFDTQLEEIRCTIDHHFIKRALLNFIYNAIRHNDDNISIILQTSIKDNEAYLTITDNGKGIAEDELTHIFERYYRGTNTAHTTGTGLGTAIARDIIEAHGGKVWLTSTLNKGTTVHITLPKNA